MTIEINNKFASNSAANEKDVRVIKRALNWLGYYMPYEKTGLCNFPDRAVFQALRHFQDDQAMHATGEINPNDETQQKLAREIERKLKGGAS